MRNQTDFLVEVSMVADQDWLSAFASHLRQSGRSERTIRAYSQDVRSFAVWFESVNGEQLSPDLITGVDLRAYRQFAIKGMAPATFNRRRACLKVLVDWAMQVGYLTYDPLQGVKLLRQEETPPRWLDNTEYHRLTRAVELLVNGAKTEAGRRQALRDQAMVALMLWAGLRESEVAQLDFGDIELSEKKGWVIVRNGKGEKRRELPLNIHARKAMREWFGLRGGEPGALFTGKRGERVTAKGIQDRVRVIRIAAGLDEDVTPHSLRHTYAKRMLDEGRPIGWIQSLMGHSRLETTLKYTKPGKKDLEWAVEV
jgi:integrase/recombinase XerC